ncbi:MAG: hypothetical protein JSR83_06365 [Proteobacteria bacterium]|uniref:hypothetical protein n=1 Tax=Thauera sp. 2A1 TaxID=2570191 RepID=UPI0012928E85|nr:hypothetical protein [Thauera sp. 2A1]KAI5915609.1 hypothetical protein GH664_06600 [Thauera sp. 2A1]MBS0353510.1 hypothetical protein [Pseudomonadota bacterium]
MRSGSSSTRIHREPYLREIAFSGQLVPQDPDESASVLLERIRGERAAGTAGKRLRGRRITEMA